jgi:hypothetical protein
MDDIITEDIMEGIAQGLTRKQIAARRNGRLGGLAKSRNYWASIQISPKLLSCKINGQKGGWAAARKYGGPFCRERAQKGGLAVLARYGREHYVRLRSLQLEHERRLRLAASEVVYGHRRGVTATRTSDYLLAGGTMPFIRRYTTNCP